MTTSEGQPAEFSKDAPTGDGAPQSNSTEQPKSAVEEQTQATDQGGADGEKVPPPKEQEGPKKEGNPEEKSEKEAERDPEKSVPNKEHNPENGEKPREEIKPDGPVANNSMEHVGTVYQAKKIIFGAEAARKAPKEDPTVELPDLSSAAIRPKGDSIRQYADLLMENRMLVITAAEEREIIGAVLGLLDHARCAGKQRRWVRRTSNRRLDEQFTLDDLLDASVAKGKPAVAVAMAYEDELSGILPRDPYSAAHLRTKLHAEDIAVILACTQADRLPGSLHVDRWDLNPQAAPGNAWTRNDAPTDRFKATVDQAPADEKPLYLTALYVAAYFNRVPVSDFKQLVDLLLEGETIERIATTSTVNDAAGFRAVGKPRTVPALELWQERGDAVLAALGIAIRTDHEGRQTLALGRAPEQREAVRYLESSQALFRDRQFDKLMSACVILRSDVSETIADRAVSLFIAMLRSEPERCTRMLNRLIDEIVEGMSGWFALFQERVESSLAFGDRLKKLFGRRKRKEAQNDLVSRVARLFTALDMDKSLQPMAWTLLDRVEAKGEGAQRFVCELLLAAAEDRRYQPSAMFWRRLHKWYDDAKHSRIRDRYYEFLTRYLARSNGDVLTVLSQLFGWLPEKDEVEPKPSSGAALAILRDYMLYSLQSISQVDTGVWPPALPLLAAVVDDTQEAVNRRHDLVQWVFHPAWQYSGQLLPPLDDELEDRKMMALMFVSCVVYLLMEKDETPVDPRSNRLARSLLETAHKNLGRQERGWFRAILDEYRATLLDLRAQNVSHREARSSIDERRRALANAVQMWHSICATTTEGPFPPVNWFNS